MTTTPPLYPIGGYAICSITIGWNVWKVIAGFAHCIIIFDVKSAIAAHGHITFDTLSLTWITRVYVCTIIIDFKYYVNFTS